MKKRIFIFLFTAFISASGVYAQSGMKDLILNKDLKIEKLIVKNEDITFTLGSISISEEIWLEYDRNGKEIGKANIEEFTENQITIKWIFADNGADVGDVTIYNYEKNDGKIIFRILFDDEQQGFFEATL